MAESTIKLTTLASVACRTTMEWGCPLFTAPPVVTVLGPRKYACRVTRPFCRYTAMCLLVLKSPRKKRSPLRALQEKKGATKYMYNAVEKDHSK